jgi:hypothetical protein
MGSVGRAPRSAGLAVGLRVLVAWFVGAALLAGCGDQSRETPGDGNPYVTDAQARRAVRRPLIDLAAGGVATTPWGAEIMVLEGSGQGSFMFAGSASGAAGAAVPGGVVVTTEHELVAHGLTPGGSVAPFLVSLPVDATVLKRPVDPRGFTVQFYDAARRAWIGTNALPVYDPDTGRVTFQIGHLSKWRVVQLIADVEQAFDRYLYVTDHFKIDYWVPTVFGTVSKRVPVDDATWHAAGGSVGTDPQVPDYIEDLAKALENALTLYQDLRASDGAKLFAPPWWLGPKMDVAVGDIGDVAGDSRLGGPLRIKARLDNLAELKITAAHELGHVMQDQHYTTLGAVMNRWFVEASATLWGLQLAGASRDAQVAYIAREMSDYLKVSLDASLEGSFYAVADFMRWLQLKTGRALVADTMRLDQVWDLQALSSLVAGPGTSLGGYFTEYALQAIAGRHDLEVTNVWTTKGLTREESGWQHRFQQFHLSAHAVEIRTNLEVDGLLVATSGRDYPYPKLQTHSYLGVGARDDVTATLEKSTAAGKPVVVPHFGKVGAPGVTQSVFQQVVLNPAERDETVWETWYFRYYLLEAPRLVLPLENGRVRWTHAAPAFKTGPNEPAPQVVAGFNVLLDGKRLNDFVLPANAREYEDSRLYADGLVQVTVVDVHGNEWPEVTLSSAPPFTHVEEVCASFRYTTVTALSGMQDGPFSTVQCIRPAVTDALGWGGTSASSIGFSVRSGTVWVAGVYDPDGPRLHSVEASRPLTGSYKTPPPLFQIRMTDVPRVIGTSIDRFKIEGAAATGRYSIAWQPEDDCSGGFCEARRVLEIDPASVSIWLTGRNW